VQVEHVGIGVVPDAVKSDVGDGHVHGNDLRGNAVTTDPSSRS
jgi:hypothetical protein